MEQRKKDLEGDKPLEPPVHDRVGFRWIQHLIRLESLINVGCHFGPDDLSPETWDGLIAMALERQFIDRLVEKRREQRKKFEDGLDKARAATGVPPPGQSLFSGKKRRK